VAKCRQPRARPSGRRPRRAAYTGEGSPIGTTANELGRTIPDDFEATVSSGVVTLTGSVAEQDKSFELVARLRHVEGAVAVRNRLAVGQLADGARSPGSKLQRAGPSRLGSCPGNAGRIRMLQREMAGSHVTWPEGAKLRFLLDTDLLRELAPGTEPAA
jgi:hypothetical protein